MTDETLCLAIILFIIGATGFVIRRNAIVVLMSVELMLNACNMAFVAFSRQLGDLVLFCGQYTNHQNQAKGLDV